MLELSGKHSIRMDPASIGDIVKSTGLRRELVYGALGWLARENKIAVERFGRAMVFSLRPLNTP
jgi:hypothetical protein